MFSKSKLFGSFIIFTLVTIGGLLSAACWQSFLTYTAPSPADFTAIKGTVKFAEERGDRKNLYLEMYLNESDVRYRVSSNYYKKYFDSDSFFTNIQANDYIVLEVFREQVKTPIRPRDNHPTIFIAGMNDTTNRYITIEDVISWSKMNNKGALILGFILSTITVMVAVLGIKELRAPESLSGQQ